MSHDIECKNGVYSFVFSAVDGPGWHKLGDVCAEDATPEQWRAQAGHNFTVSKRPLFYRNSRGDMQEYLDRFGMVRDDNDHALGIASDVYKLAQPSEIDDICDTFASYDDKLKRSSAFTLRNGDLICSTYAYRDPVTIGGDKHNAYLMASTSFDGASSTKFWISIIRAVCANTIAAGLGESKAIVSVRHNAKLVATNVQAKLAELAQQVTAYKALGDSLARVIMSEKEISAFFKAALDIPTDAKPDDISIRKMNQFRALSRAFSVTKNAERGGSFDAFTALNAITRYVDHYRSVRQTIGNDGKPIDTLEANNVARFDSANFGSGAQFKNRAVALLMPMIQDRIAA